MNHPAPAAIAALTLCLGAGLADADTITLTSTRDNTLYEDGAGALSNGAGIHTFVGRSGGGGGTRIVRSLLHFDVASSIPAGSTITGVTLRLNASTPQGTTGFVDVFALQRDWGEGSSDAPGGEGGGAPASAGDATWLHTFFSGSTWTNPGGDFDPTAQGSFEVRQNGIQSVADAGLVAQVQAWVDGTDAEFGWLLRARNEAGGAIRFDTREHPSPSLRPSLQIDYVVPSPSGLMLGACAGGLLSRRRRR